MSTWSGSVEAESSLRGRTAPWGPVWSLVLIGCAAVGFALRAHGLSAEGFADDEVHKWLAANRYLAGDFGGDDLEHPMLMKALIALCLALAPRGAAPEAIAIYKLRGLML